MCVGYLTCSRSHFFSQFGMWIEIEADPNSRPQMKQITEGRGMLGLRIMAELQLIQFENQ